MMTKRHRTIALTAILLDEEKASEVIRLTKHKKYNVWFDNNYGEGSKKVAIIVLSLNKYKIYLNK